MFLKTNNSFSKLLFCQIAYTLICWGPKIKQTERSSGLPVDLHENWKWIDGSTPYPFSCNCYKIEVFAQTSCAYFSWHFFLHFVWSLGYSVSVCYHFWYFHLIGPHHFTVHSCPMTWALLWFCSIQSYMQGRKEENCALFPLSSFRPEQEPERRSHCIMKNHCRISDLFYS